jgi:hypothetical protein
MNRIADFAPPPPDPRQQLRDRIDEIRSERALCADCASSAPSRTWRRCNECLREYSKGIRRRRLAEQRMQPLVDLVGAR